ncbi:TPA: DUF1270 family protein, partial [Staphylococcus aureus]|nr:DUF1270 family protein [Staphylococcus aureus]
MSNIYKSYLLAVL